MHFSDSFNVQKAEGSKQPNVCHAVLKPTFKTANFIHAWTFLSERWKHYIYRTTITFAYHGFSHTVRISFLSREWVSPHDLHGISRNVNFTTSTSPFSYRNHTLLVRIHPQTCSITSFTDDELTEAVDSRRFLHGPLGRFSFIGRDAAELNRFVTQGQWSAAIVRVSANATTQMHEPVERVRNAPDPIPVNIASDPRFRSLARCSDYLIRCRGGTLTASLHMLAVRSGYFRRLLLDSSTAETQANAHSLDFPVEIVSPLITFIQTDTFDIEPSTPLYGVLKMVQLIDELDPSEPEKLKNGIANCLHRRFDGSKNNVHDLALIAAISLLLPFERLAICALKLIANDHYIAFTEHYRDTAADQSHQEVYGILALDRDNDRSAMRFSHDEHLLFPDADGFFRPLTYVHKVREASFSTRLIWSQD